MADMQKYFRQFHDAIAVKRDQEKLILSKKREAILDRLSAWWTQQRKDGNPLPTYRVLNQGSYAMGTGIKPLKGDYDLDTALLFELSKDKFDPLTVKQWVHAALENHTRKVVVRRPCVTVWYHAEGEPIYHVDLAVYAAANGDGKTYLAIGKAGADAKNRSWDISEPEHLLQLMKEKFADKEDDRQFRRCIRYLKRWKDINFPIDGHAAPRGIALTACAYKWFRVAKQVDTFANTSTYDDGKAARGLVDAMLAGFQKVNQPAPTGTVQRLVVDLPVPPGNDLFAKMNADQMGGFRARLQDLGTALDRAATDPDPHTAAQALAKVFGDAFPIPEKQATAQRRAPAIVSSGNSG